MTNILSFFIPYRKIDFLFNEYFKDKNYNKCTFIIDLPSMLNTLFIKKYEYDNELGQTLLIDILNLIIHYVRYLYNKVDYRVVLVYSDNTPKSCLSFYDEYNFSTFIDRSNNSYIRSTMIETREQFNKLSKYLYNIYYIETDADSTHFINKLIKESEKDRVNIILSKDITLVQNIVNDDIILRPYKDMRTHEDLSYLIHNNNKLNRLISSYKIKNEFEFNFDKTDNNIIAIFMAMCGLRQRYIPRTFKVKETVEILNQYSTKFSHIVPDEIFNNFTDKELGETIYSYYKAISSAYQFNFIKDSINFNIIKKLTDRQLLSDINNKIFDGRIDFELIQN